MKARKDYGWECKHCNETTVTKKIMWDHIHQEHQDLNMTPFNNHVPKEVQKRNEENKQNKKG